MELKTGSGGVSHWNSRPSSPCHLSRHSQDNWEKLPSPSWSPFHASNTGCSWVFWEAFLGQAETCPAPGFPRCPCAIPRLYGSPMEPSLGARLSREMEPLWTPAGKWDINDPAWHSSICFPPSPEIPIFYGDIYFMEMSLGMKIHGPSWRFAGIASRCHG